jgi:multidrug efflux system membrane fusion protein
MQNTSAAALAAARARTRGTGKVGIVGIVVTLLVILGLGLLAWKLGQSDSGGAGGPGGGPGGPGGPPGGFGGGRGGFATTVGVATAAARDIPLSLEALGTVTPVATVTVRPQVSGVIKEIRFQEGQVVERGQILAIIDPRPFEMTLQQARGALQRDQAELENAKLQLERFRTLLDQDSIAEQEVDAQAASVKQLEGAVVADRATVEAAKLDLDYSAVKSPVTGRAGLRVVDAGNYIGAGDSSGIVVVTQMAPMDVEFTVPQDRVSEILSNLSAGEPLAATALDRTRTNTLATGEFLTLDNLVNTETGTVRAKARFANTDGVLFPNQFVNLRLKLRTIDNAVVVPTSAVRNGSEGDFVWLIAEDHTVSQRKIKRGTAADDMIQIVEGLQIGDRVVTEGGDRLKEGAKVQLPGETPASGGDRRNADGKPRERRAPAEGEGRKPAANPSP